MTKDETKKEVQQQINEDLVPVLEAISELLDENEEVLDKFGGIGAKILLKCANKLRDAMDHDFIDKMAAKQAMYFGCLWTHLTEDCGFTTEEAIQIVAGARR